MLKRNIGHMEQYHTNQNNCDTNFYVKFDYKIWKTANKYTKFTRTIKEAAFYLQKVRFFIVTKTREIKVQPQLLFTESFFVVLILSEVLLLNFL